MSWRYSLADWISGGDMTRYRNVAISMNKAATAAMRVAKEPFDYGYAVASTGVEKSESAAMKVGFYVAVEKAAKACRESKDLIEAEAKILRLALKEAP